jgi:chromosome segregation ATPase
LIERVSNTIKEADAVYDAHSETARAVADLRREYERELAILRREVDELKRDRERWGQRLWMVLAPLIAGAAGVLLAYQLGVRR